MGKGHRVRETLGDEGYLTMEKRGGSGREEGGRGEVVFQMGVFNTLMGYVTERDQWHEIG